MFASVGYIRQYWAAYVFFFICMQYTKVSFVFCSCCVSTLSEANIKSMQCGLVAIYDHFVGLLKYNLLILKLPNNSDNIRIKRNYVLTSLTAFEIWMDLVSANN